MSINAIGARDPNLSPELVRLRWEVLTILRGIGRDADGKGMTLSTLELRDLLTSILDYEPDGKLVGQAARWFGRARRKNEDETEWVLFWRNAGEEDSRWGLRQQRTDEDVDRVLAGYSGRLAANALARSDESKGVKFEVPPNAGPDAKSKIADLVARADDAGSTYEIKNVDDFVDRFLKLSPWERANVLFRLSEEAVEIVRTRARKLAEIARTEDEV